MNDQPGQRKTRRRFLADMLFLGGGLTAAGLLAKSQFSPVEPSPQAAGEMVMPIPCETPKTVATPEPEPDRPPLAGAPKPPPTPPPDKPAPKVTKPVKPVTSNDPFDNRPTPIPDHQRPAPNGGPQIMGRSSSPRPSTPISPPRSCD